ncbi:MAG: hypothetical protein LBU89_04310 [Fibromonadaceae bacterium]|jgi:hypothetical protein|nr:hypothetical protein [Fibromonadaceae bacterium]
MYKMKKNASLKVMNEQLAKNFPMTYKAYQSGKGAGAPDEVDLIMNVGRKTEDNSIVALMVDFIPPEVKDAGYSLIDIKAVDKNTGEVVAAAENTNFLGNAAQSLLEIPAARFANCKVEVHGAVVGKEGVDTYDYTFDMAEYSIDFNPTFKVIHPAKQSASPKDKTINIVYKGSLPETDYKYDNTDRLMVPSEGDLKLKEKALKPGSVDISLSLKNIDAGKTVYFAGNKNISNSANEVHWHLEDDWRKELDEIFAYSTSALVMYHLSIRCNLQAGGLVNFAVTSDTTWQTENSIKIPILQLFHKLQEKTLLKEADIRNWISKEWLADYDSFKNKEVNDE